MAVKFDGLPGGVTYPADIEVFLKVTDAPGRLIEKAFHVRLTISAGVPVIQDVYHSGLDQPSGVFTVHHANFSLSEAGSRIECLYPSGLRYECLPDTDGNGVPKHNRTETTLIVPDIAEGNDVRFRLVNDSGASGYQSATLNSKTRSERLLVTAPPAALAAFSQVKVSPIEFNAFDDKKNDCNGGSYVIWKSISPAENIQVEPYGVPVTVSMKFKPEIGSLIKESNQIIFEWSGAGVKSLNWTAPFSYRVFDAKCPSRVLAP